MPTKTRIHAETEPMAAGPGVTNGHESKPTLLSRAAILKAEDVRTEIVDVPEWGGSVLVRGLSGAARDTIEQQLSDDSFRYSKDRFGNFRAVFVAYSVIDEDGNLLFSADDIDALGRKSSVALQRIYDVATRLSAIRPDDVDGMTDGLKDDQNA